MKNFLEKTRQWLPSIVVILLALFTIVRMQAAQAYIQKEVNKKLDSGIYEADKNAVVRELDLIHKTLERFEGKFDRAFNKQPQTNPETFRD